MGWADFYFNRYKIIEVDYPEADINFVPVQIVVIPAFDEPELFDTLDCLRKNKDIPPTAVVVVLNAKETTGGRIKQLHREQYEAIKQIPTENNLKFIPILAENLPSKTAGAGMARKIGMDYALKIFDHTNNKQGIIISLDADTLCPQNYLKTIYKEFRKRPKAQGATIAFEHPVEGTKYSGEIYKAITLYELYLRYYIQALRYSGFPYAYHTIGSAFAVRAGAYAKQGGMGLQQAGEDFYFLHKIIPTGEFFEIKSTKVYPSPRISDRVPFGTGVVIDRITKQNQNDYPTYPLESFEMLKTFFEQKDQLFKNNNFELKVNPVLSQYLESINFRKRIEEINRNSSRPETFDKRFFAWFDVPGSMLSAL